MSDDDCGGAVGDWIGKHLSWMDLGFVDKAYGNNPGCDDFIGTIYGNTDKVFLFAVSIMAD